MAVRPNLLDSQSFDDGTLLSIRKEQMRDALETRHYMALHRSHNGPLVDMNSAGYHPVTVVGIPCELNAKNSKTHLCIPTLPSNR